MSVRAKFRCNSSVEAHGGQQIVASAITAGPGASEEDKAFWDATPNGSLTMYVSAGRCEGFFEPGAEFYVTFERVSE